MNILDYVPKGKINRISTQELMKKTGITTPRALRKLIRQQRAKGAIIASTKADGGGYFIPESRAELLDYAKETERQGASTFATLKATRELLKLPEGQLSLEVDNDKTEETGHH